MYRLFCNTARSLSHEYFLSTNEETRAMRSSSSKTKTLVAALLLLITVPALEFSFVCGDCKNKLARKRIICESALNGITEIVPSAVLISLSRRWWGYLCVS